MNAKQPFHIIQVFDYPRRPRSTLPRIVGIVLDSKESRTMGEVSEEGIYSICESTECIFSVPRSSGYQNPQVYSYKNPFLDHILILI
jgi:hypothetical protein